MVQDPVEPFRVDDPAIEIGSLELLMYPGFEPGTGLVAERLVYFVLVDGVMCAFDGEVTLWPASEAL